MIASIRQNLRHAWHAAPVATVVLIAALAATSLFAVRTTVFWVAGPPLAERQQAVAGWMTPRYVARSWGVPPRLLLEAIGAPMPPPDGPMTLAEIADLRGVPVGQVVREAEAAIAAIRSARRPAGSAGRAAEGETVE